MRVEFTKMHGLGNDFVVIDATSRPITLHADQARALADRHRGVGCDQVLLVERPRTPGADFRYRIFNADGGEVEQCGNGARCFALFVRARGLTDKDEIRVETAAGLITPRVQADGQVSVDMGVPRFEPTDVPFEAPARAPRYALEAGGEALEIFVVSMGNPHAVLLVPDVEAAPVTRLGPLIESHPRFPRRANAGFLEIVSPGFARLRVYERGAGETLACGTGACAAAVCGVGAGLLQSPVRVAMRGGELSVAWAGEGTPVQMTGPAVTVFEGVIDL